MSGERRDDARRWRRLLLASALALPLMACVQTLGSPAPRHPATLERSARDAVRVGDVVAADHLWERIQRTAPGTLAGVKAMLARRQLDLRSARVGALGATRDDPRALRRCPRR